MTTNNGRCELRAPSEPDHAGLLETGCGHTIYDEMCATPRDKPTDLLLDGAGKGPAGGALI